MANKLFEKLEDAVTLDVTTLSGAIDIKLDAAPANDDESKKAFKDIAARVEKAVADGTATGTIEVVGWTKVELDKDVKQFFRSGLTAETKAYLEAHNRAVETSLAQRSKFIETMFELI